MKQHCYSVYIMASGHYGTLYIGVTNDLENRVYDHKNKTFKGFTEKYDVNKLMYYENFQYIEEAIQREKQMKAWKREWKIRLIEENNSRWEDLAYNWHGSQPALG